MTKQRYLVKTGLTYNNDRRRAEIGDVVDDLPRSAIADLLAINAIEPVAEEPTTDEGED